MASQVPTNVSTYFYDASCIALSFSDPSSAYFNNAQPYYYIASAVDTAGNKTTYATGYKSPIYIQGLSAGYTYNCSLYVVQTASSDSISFTTLSYPTVSDISLSDVSFNFINVKWTATDVSYVKVTRRIGTTQPYLDICGGDYASPYYDSDISGNTTYYYYITPYMTKYGSTTGGSLSSVVSATTPVAYPTDVTATFTDTSAIGLSFSTPKNTYTSVVYSAIANHSTLGYTSTVTGTSPILIQNLSSGTTYTCYIQVNLNGGTIGTSSGLSVNTVSLVTTKVYYLIVGGGGGASVGGGGAGTVIYNSTGADLSNNQSYAIIIGDGGAGGAESSSNGSNGYDSIISGTNLVSTSIIAKGGGGGGKNSSSGNSGGSGGGGGMAGGTMSGGSSTKILYTGHSVYGNAGGSNGGYNTASYPGGGGGGAFETGYAPTSSNNAGNGGSGIAIDITGTSVYYGGGGGAGIAANTPGSGGLGGGGNGSTGNGNAATANTGGGGGGCGFSSTGGSGGSGVVILKVPNSILGRYWGSPIVSSVGNYNILKYISSGTYENTPGISNSFTNYSFSTLSTSFDTTGTSDWCTYCSYTGQYLYSCSNSTTIYRSSNYGNSWSSTAVTTGGMFGICCSWDGSIVYTCGGGYIYKSTNYGATFTQLQSGLNANIRPICCSYDGVYIYCSSYGGITYFSNNSGSTWSSTTVNGGYDIIRCSPDGKYVIATVDGGNSYYLNNSSLTTPSSGWVNTGFTTTSGKVAISQNGTYMLVAASNYWKLTTNGGTTWSTLPYPVNNANALQGCAMSYTGQYMIVGYGSGGGIYYSCDYGTTWNLITNSTSYIGGGYTNMSMAASGAYAMANNSSKTSYFLMKGLIDQYTSMSFSILPTFDTTSAGDWDTASSYTGQYLYACGGATTIYRSSNYGTTWLSTTVSYAMYGVCCSWDGSIVYAAGTSYVYKSTDYGVTFTSVVTNLHSSLRPICCSSDGIYVYAGSMSSSFYYSSNSGSSWATSSGTNSTGFLGLSCSYDGKYLIAAKWNGNAFYLNNSTLSNAGGNWTDSGVSGSTTTCGVAISENGKYMLANNNTTAWKLSSNGGATWNTLPYPVNGSTAIVGCAMSHTGQYMIVGYGSPGGIYYSFDYGNSWSLITGSTQYTSAGGTSTRNMCMAPSGAYAMANNNSKSSYFLMTGKVTKLIGSETYYYRFEPGDLSTYTMADYSSGLPDGSTKAATLAVYSGSTYPYLTTTTDGAGYSSLLLNSSNYNYMSIPSFTMSTSSGFSVSFCANAFTLSGSKQETIIHLGSNSTGTYGIEVQSASAANYSIITSSSAGTTTISVSTSYWPMTTYQWNHVTITFSYLTSTTATCYYYINGTLANTGGTTCNFPWNTSMSYNYVGRQISYDANTFWNGCIDELRIFNGTVLSSANVTTLFGYTNVPNMTSFTAISSFGTKTTAATFSGYTIYSVSVSADKTKMLFFSGGGVYYATYINGSWSVNSTALKTGLSTNCPGVQLSAAGNYGVVSSGYDVTSYVGLIDWTKNIPILIQITNSLNTTGCAISNDGHRIVIASRSNGIYYADYPNWTLTQTLQTGNSNQVAIAISPDKSTILYTNISNNSYLTYSTWNGTNYSAGTSLGIYCDLRCICFLGGGYSGTPTNLFIKVTGAGGSVFNTANGSYYVPWNQSTKTLGTVTLLSSSIISQADTITNCNGCSNGITYYYGQGDTGVYYTNIGYDIINRIGSETYYYIFDSVSSNKVADYSSGTADTTTKVGTLANYSGTTYATISTTQYAVGSSSLYLSRSNTNYMTIPSFTVSTNTAISMSFWMNSVGLSTYDVLFDLRSSAGNSNITFQYNSTQSSYQVNVNNGTGGGNTYITTSYLSTTTNQWNHVVLVFSFASTTTATAYVYVNNILTNINGTTINNFPWNTTMTYSYIGIPQPNLSNTTTHYWNGYIDDFRIFNGTALTAANVTTLYKYKTLIITAIPIYTAVSTTVTVSSDTTTVSAGTGPYAYANGSYVFSASSGSVNDGAWQYAYQAFNNYSTTQRWHACWSSGTSASNTYGTAYTQYPYTGSYSYKGGGSAATTYSTTVSGVAYGGEWLQVKYPYKLTITSYFLEVNFQSRPMKYWVIAGSNDGSTWYLIDDQSATTLSAGTGTTYTVSSSTGYYYYRAIFLGGDSAGTLTISRWNLYGISDA